MGAGIGVPAAKRSSNYTTQVAKETSSANIATSNGPSDVNSRPKSTDSSNKAPDIPGTSSLGIIQTPRNPSTMSSGAGTAAPREGIYSNRRPRRTEVDNSPNYKSTSNIARQAAESIQPASYRAINLKESTRKSYIRYSSSTSYPSLGDNTGSLAPTSLG